MICDLCKEAMGPPEMETDIKKSSVEGRVIKPCPFCGGDGKVVRFPNMAYEAGCFNNDCEIKPGTYSVETKKEAIDMWNERAL